MDTKTALEQVKDRLRGYWLRKPEYIVLGSLNTMNTGDIAIISVVKEFISKNITRSVRCLSWRYYAIRGIENVVVCGGDVLHDRNQENLKRIDTLLSNNKHVIFLGVGVPGFYLSKPEEVHRVLSKAKRIVVRDEVSFKRLKQLGLDNVTNSFDNAFMMQYTSKNKDSSSISATIKKVGINIKTYSSVRPNNKWTEAKNNVIENRRVASRSISIEQYIANYKVIIEKLKIQRFEVRVINFTHQDFLFVKKYFPELSSSPYYKEPNRLINEIENTDAMFFTRYHSLVFSLICGKPVYGFAYADKVENLLDKFLDIKFIDRKEWKAEITQSVDFQSVNSIDIVELRDFVYRNCYEALTNTV